MNAVKRCLALFAATVVVGACSGDPTAVDAGANPTIRATPGAVWVRNNANAAVIIEAVDKLGGPVEGTWASGTITGPFTVVVDPTYRPSSTGAIGTATRFVITPTAEGEGSVVFTGTGGPITVPVRIAPDTSAFDVTLSDTTPALFQAVTVTAPAGIVFTPSATVRFYDGPLPLDSANGGLSFPAILSWSADSTQMTFVPGPSATGFMRISGVASRSTPGLTTTARAPFQMAAVSAVDTNAFSLAPAFRSTGNRTTTSIFDTLVLTAPAGYRFVGTSGTAVEFFRLLPTAPPSATNPSGYTVVNGTSTPKVIAMSADSDTLYVLVTPGSRGRLKLNTIAFDAAPLAQPNGIRFRTRGPSSETFDLRTSIDTSNFAITFSKASPIAEGDTVTATLPAGMVFLPGTVMINAAADGAPSGGDSARIVLFSPDSSKVTFRLPPGASGKFRYSNIARRDHPQIVWRGRSAGTISAVAAPAVAATVTPGTVNMNDTVSIALDPFGPYRFRPTSTAEVLDVPAAFARVSADSLTLKVLPTPGSSGALILTNILYAALPTFQVKAATASSVTVNAPFSVGADDPVASAVFAAPTATGSSNARGWWDAVTMLDSDPSPDCDGGVGAQFYTLTVATAGSYTITVNWIGTISDIDFGVMVKDGGYDGGGSCSDYLSTSGLSGAKPERNTALTLAVGTYVIGIIDFEGDFAAGDALSVNVVKN